MAERRRTRRRTWGNCGKNINSSPASDIVWRAGGPAQLVSNKMSGFIQGCPAPGNIVPQLWLRAPQQCHRAGDMRRCHRGAAKAHVSVIRRVIAGARACAWCRDIGLYPIALIDCNRPAAAKVCNHILASIQRADGVRCSVDCRRIHDGRTIGTVVAGARHHHNPGRSLSFDSSLQGLS